MSEEYNGEIIQALREAKALMASLSAEERTQIIQYGHNNRHLIALAVAALAAAKTEDANFLRVVVDTAFCLGVKHARLRKDLT